MRRVLWTLFFLGAVAVQVTNAQSTTKFSKRQYGFIIVINKEATKLFFSPVFAFDIDKGGDPLCDLGQLENTYREKIADEQFDVLTSDYFDTKEQALEARSFDIDSKKKAGKTVSESNTVVGECL